MNEFKRRLAILTFITNFFFRMGFLFLVGFILLIAAFINKSNQCLVYGVALLAFDFIVSIIETVNLFRTLKMSNHAFVKDVSDAINSDDPYGNLEKILPGNDVIEDIPGGFKDIPVEDEDSGEEDAEDDEEL